MAKLNQSPVHPEVIAAVASLPVAVRAQTMDALRGRKITNKQTAPSKGVHWVVEPISKGERAVFVAAWAVEKALYEVDNKRAAVVAAVRALFGDELPSFEAYRALQEACKIQAVQAGSTGQAIRKHVAAAVNQCYGKLPESDSPEAARKRAQRLAAQPKKSAKPDADPLAAGNTSGGHVPASPTAETIESFIARVGPVAVLAALSRIYETEESTKVLAEETVALIEHAVALKAA